MLLPNYRLIYKIAETDRSVVYKAYHVKNPDHLLVLKVFRSRFLSESKKAALRQRIEHLRILDSPLVLIPNTFEVKDDTCYITYDYFNGIPLSEAVLHWDVSLDAFLRIACQLAQALTAVHTAGIIHGGIKPNNILVNADSLDIRLIDFVSLSNVSNVSHFVYEESFVRGTLPYTSPEQTGRIRHRVSFSSDLYSLGAVFYEMLTGHPPFLNRDPLELIHAHLAEEASPVHESNQKIPPTLSRIVSKLLAKEAEKRYQCSESLLADLERCRKEYLSTGTISDFSLENSLRTERVIFVSKMVGRDKEAEKLLRLYQEAAGGEFRALFISGPSGIGKTRLIQELQAPIVREKGYFTSGKFDLYQRDIPYCAIIQGLRRLVQTFLSESDERVAMWKERILGAVGHNGRVLTDVIPELEMMIGPQPELKSLPPVEALNRFRDVFNRFLGCLASEDNPLTLFIDDLQWCDTATLEFLTYILANYQDHPYLFLLGAYRSDEVDPSHPVARLVRNAKKMGRYVEEMKLGPLEPEHCHEMVAYILNASLSQTDVLSDFISKLSEGNPLYVNESLTYFRNADLLFLDESSQWRWDMEKIRNSNMPKTVAALFCSKIRKLPAKLISMLEYCACMGNTFSPKQLASLFELTLIDAFRLLRPALEQGLLIETQDSLQFVHDKVQEAVLSTIPQARRRRIHWRIGTFLLSTVPCDSSLEKADNLFTIVSHLNLGRTDELDVETRYMLSRLNYYAGNKALSSLATEAANEYFNLGLSLLPDDCWDDEHYEETFRIYQRTAKTELMCGHHTRSEILLNTLLEHARTDLDKAECLAEQTTSLASIGELIKAIETAKRGLAYLGVHFPSSASEVERTRQELTTELAALGANVCDAVPDMPFTQDRKSQIELAYYSDLISCLYATGRVAELYLAAAQSVRNCLSGGMDESVIYAFTIMGLQFAEQGDYELAFRYEDLARQLSAKYPNTFGATRGMNWIVWCTMHSRSHPRDIVEYCLKSIQCGKNCGDLYNAGLSYGPLMWNLQVQGAELALIDEYAKECLEFSRRFHLSLPASLAEAMQAGWITPMRFGFSDSLMLVMEGKVKQWEQDNYMASAGSYYVHVAIAYYYFGQYEKAEEYLVRVRRYLSGLTDNVLKRQWHVFVVLNALRLYEKGSRYTSKEELFATIQPVLDKLETWAKFGPLLRPYLALIRAEIARVTQDDAGARNLYLDGIDLAHRQGYVLLEGYLYECLGELTLQMGQSSAKVFLQEAVRLYKECGAERKEISLIEKYPEYLQVDKATPANCKNEYSFRLLPDLDVQYLVKSSLAISAEIGRESLMRKIMDVVLESSGAQRGFLLLEEDGKLYVRAASHAKQPDVLNRPLEQIDEICKSIVWYVYRTGQKLLLDDACSKGVFRDNPEVQKLRLRSVLCLPIVKLCKTIGVLYLDNRLASSVFTLEKAQMTELLTLQVAISIQNSRLVAGMKKVEQELRQAKRDLEKRVQERTAELAEANTLLQKDIAVRERIESSLKAERQRFYNVLEMLPVYLLLITEDYHVTFANRYFRERYGVSNEKCCYEFLFGYDRPCENCQAFRIFTGSERVEWEWIGPDGAIWQVYDFPFIDSDGAKLILEMGIDITAQKKADAEVQKLNAELERRVEERTAQLAVANRDLFTSEAHLREALHEKETLLKEIHHRVKNNLQIIQSMLNLQVASISDPQVVQLFRESQSRIFSMALIHEKLYQSKQLAKIDLAEYIKSLAANLFLSYGVTESKVKLVVDVDDVNLDAGAVVPCALIINELVSNSLKYAFIGSDRFENGMAQIVISLQRDRGGKLRLTVEDNGVGLPEGFTVNTSQSLGLKLVSVLTRQLKGTLQVVSNASGTKFIIVFAE